MMFSPFRFCNGTRTVERDHRFNYYGADEDLGDFVFLDYAGSGVVHLCGKLKTVTFYTLTMVTSKAEWQHLCSSCFTNLKGRFTKENGKCHASG